tara:strand:+ start:19320 stop:19562 length:243 start_codon:yes stop_codon:yes gene_type:complete
MVYTVDDIEKIVEFKSWTERKKIDELLRIDCSLYCNLGTDSSFNEKKQVKKNSRKIYQNIRKIDKRIGDEFLTAMEDWSE